MENFIFCAVSHQNTINEKPKEDPITVKPNENPINEHLLELQDPQWLLRHKKIFLAFWKWYMMEWVMGINFGLERPHLHANSHLKIEAKVFFS